MMKYKTSFEEHLQELAAHSPKGFPAKILKMTARELIALIGRQVPSDCGSKHELVRLVSKAE